jgi:hypothetical protein
MDDLSRGENGMQMALVLLCTLMVVSAAGYGTGAAAISPAADLVAARDGGPRIERTAWVIAQNADPAPKRLVPPVTGLTESQARERLKERGFTGKVTAYLTSPTVKCPSGYQGYMPGRVCASKPDGDVRLDTDIALLIQGEWTVDDPFGMPPNVMGLSREEAVKVLAEHRFTDLRYQFVEDAACPARTVCGLNNGRGDYQRPDGTWVADRPAMRTVELNILIGTAHPRGTNRLDAPMINIVGDTLDSALDKLDRFGVRGAIGMTNRLGCPREIREMGGGRVCAQRPPAGQRVVAPASGFRVEYVLAEDKAALPTRSADDSPFSADTAPPEDTKDAGTQTERP